jgi:hypothetical protein
MRKAIVVAAATVGSAAAIMAAVFELLPDAHADSSTDQQFLTVLQNMGLGYPSPDYAISHAHATCDYMAEHPHDQAAVDNYVAATTIWTGVNAVMFKDYSAVSYCPQFASE